MPHCHSEAAQWRRNARAADRGYLAPNSDGQFRWLRVPAALAVDVRLMAKSLQLHRSHEAMAGERFHYARHATLAAVSGHDLRSMALAAHRRANRAKHRGIGSGLSSSEEGLSGELELHTDPWSSWRPGSSDEEGLAVGSVASLSLLDPSAATPLLGGEVDPLLLHDPWRRRAPDRSGAAQSSSGLRPPVLPLAAPLYFIALAFAFVWGAAWSSLAVCRVCRRGCFVCSSDGVWNHGHPTICPEGRGSECSGRNIWFGCASGRRS